MSLTTLLILYLAFRFKQLVCDFFLQTKWMALEKGHAGWEGYKPLFVHAGIHGLGTFIIFVMFAPHLWWISLVDVVVHAAIDRFKARLTDSHNWTAHSWKFWWAFGIDQEAHNLTHIIYIGLILLQTGLQ